MYLKEQILSTLSFNVRSFKFILIFLLVFIIGDRILSKSLLIFSKFSSLPYAKVYSEKAESDILILGDSRAYHHLNDNDWNIITKKKTLSLSITGSPMILQEVLLRDYIAKYGNPKLIVIELNALISPFDKIISFKYLGLMSENFKLIMSKYFYKQYILCEIFNLFFLNTTDYLNILHKIFVDYEQPKLLGKITEDELQRVLNNKYTPYFQNKKYNINSLNRIINDFGDNNKFIFIITPFHEVFLEKQIEKDEWLAEIKKLVSDDRRIYDYSKSITNDEYYFDDRHLNDKGVTKLLDIMKRDNFFHELI